MGVQEGGEPVAGKKHGVLTMFVANTGEQWPVAARKLRAIRFLRLCTRQRGRWCMFSDVT